MARQQQNPNRKNIRGIGTLERRTTPDADGTQRTIPTWHVDFRVNGVRYRETTGTDNYNDAVKFLKRRISEVETGKFAGPKVEKTLMSELLNDVLDDYKMHHPDSVQCFASPIINGHLLPWFGHMRAIAISTSAIRAYIKDRMTAKTGPDGKVTDAAAMPATINREVSMLRRAFNLARTQTPPKVVNMPVFKGLFFEENNARQGFFEWEQYVAVRDALPEDERAVFVSGYYTLMRYRALTMMKWDWVYLDTEVIRVPPGITKNDEPLLIPTGGPGTEFHDLLAARLALRNEVCPATPWVFFRSVNRGNRGKSTRQVGKPVKTIRHLLDKVRQTLGLEARLFHDLRRTGARDMRKAKVSEGVIMALGNWKTRAVFERYNIKDETDLHDAAAARNKFLADAQNRA